MELDSKPLGNIEFACYPSGHMIYLNVDTLKQLKSDLAARVGELLPNHRDGDLPLTRPVV